MKIINVITIENGIIDEIKSFGIYEEELFSDDVVEKAEKYFFKKAEKYGWTPDEIDEDDLLEDGMYITDDASVSLVWSYTD